MRAKEARFRAEANKTLSHEKTLSAIKSYLIKQINMRVSGGFCVLHDPLLSRPVSCSLDEILIIQNWLQSEGYEIKHIVDNYRFDVHW